MSTASTSPAIAGAGVVSLLLFVFGALSPLRIAVSGLALFGGGLFGAFVCLLSLAR